MYQSSFNIIIKVCKKKSQMYSKPLLLVSILKILKKIQLKIELLNLNKRGKLRIKRKILE